MSALSFQRLLTRPGALTIAAVALLLAAPQPGRAQSLDLNGNGASDLWETLYQMEDADLEYDSDGDGVTDALEAVAGTDPLNSQSVPRLSGIRLTSQGVEISMPGLLGKRYQLEGSALGHDGAPTNWVAQGSQIPRVAPLVSLVVPADQPVKFFRMQVSDVDTDGDGLNDWEEYQLGLDPLSATSNGERDGNGRPLNDYAYIRRRLLTQSLASLIQSPVALASRPQPAGAICGVAASGGSPIVAASGPSGTGLTAQYYTNSSVVYTNAANFNPGNLFLTTNDAVVDFTWSTNTVPNLNGGLYTVRWTGQVEPQYSETYFFQTRTDDGVKLWVNDQLLIDKWQFQGTTSWTNAIKLVAGVRYNIRMEYFNGGSGARAQLSWFSPSQARQVIPANRLYPSSGGYAPAAVTSPLTAVAFVGQPFTYTLTGANSPLAYDVTNVPPGLSFDSTNAVLGGIPNLAGIFDVGLAVSNAVGVGTATLRLEVIDSGSSVTREVWLAAPGTSVADIPLGTPATQTNSLGTLEGITNFGENYGERVRGYLIAPVSGNYYFWLAANNAAEFWLSNDAEPANKVRRAVVAKPTLPRQWTLQPGQRSAWIALEAGRRYYLEVLHKAGKGANDNWSVGWLMDPTGTNTAPGGVVPGFVLAPYVETPPSEIPGTLYSANLVAQSGALSTGVGSATLRLSADETQAVLRFSYSGLSSPETAKHIHADAYLGRSGQGQIIFDIDTATPEVDGSYVWTIAPAGSLSVADIVEIIKQGKSYINVHSVDYPGGEINGHFGIAAGARTFTPPPLPPVWAKDHASSNAAARFLLQATFGATPASIKSVRALGYEGWINSQFKARIGGHLTNVYANANSDPNYLYPGVLTFNTWWKQSVTAPDQLRQRVAFALSQIMVVSEAGPLSDNARALSAYYDVLLKHAFGNFRELLEAVTLSPAMGIYLDMRRNDRGNIVLGTHPNENYAREILQLFSVGLNRMWPDGTLVLNSQGDIVPTYNQDVIIGFAHVFTGWNYWQTNQANKRLPSNWSPAANYTNAMVLVPTHHELDAKRLLDNVVLPPASGTYADPAHTNFDVYCSRDLELAHDVIFQNENVGPFICRQLIQRMVTSHPSRDYLYRVVQKFNDNGEGVRGDMKAVIKAILLDYEARSTNAIAEPTSGKQREPLLRATSIARAFQAPAPVTGVYRQSGSSIVTITTTKPHRLSSSDDVFLSFSGASAPASQIYNNVSVSNAHTFSITVPGAAFGTYAQAGNVITVTNSGHGLSVGHQIYLTFTSGGAHSGSYAVASVISGSVFTVATSDPASRSGSCAFPRWTGGGYVQSTSNITFTTVAPHGLAAGKYVFVDFRGGISSSNGVYRVKSVLGPNRFMIVSTVSASTSGSDPLLLPLSPAPIVRSGSVKIRYSTWNMGYTDSGFSSSLSQTPLNSPTVFNYYFPDYKYQGILAAAGLTTPEFQLTSDTSVVLQMNYFSSSIFNNGSNTNGLSSFTGGNGSIMLDLGPWMNPAATANAGIPAMVDAMNTLLCGGQLSAAARGIITAYVADNTRFPYSSPTPTGSQMRDRVRAVAHLIISSPEFIVQR